MCQAKRITTLIIICIVTFNILFFSGCRKKASEEIGFGSFEGSVYTNEYFGLKIAFPSDWSIQDNETKKQLMDMGGKIIAQNDDDLETIRKANELKSVNLFVVFRYPPGSPVSSNPSITGVAEKVGFLPGIKRGKDYLFHARELLESSALDISFPQEVYSEEVGGYLFDVMPVNMEIQNTLIMQKYYSVVMKGYALNIITTYIEEDEESVLNDILATMQKIN